MKKRALTLLCVLILLLSASSPAAALQQSGDWFYIVTDSSAYIVGYGGTSTEMNIPAKLGGYVVTTISDDAIGGLNELVIVSMPDTITSMGARNFVYCPNLTTVYLSSQLFSAGEGCFEGCGNLQMLLRNGEIVPLESLLSGEAADSEPAAEYTVPEDFTRRARALGYTFKDGVLIEYWESQVLPVYSGPGIDYYRAADGKAAVSTAGAVYGTYNVLRKSNRWMLIIYGTSSGNSRYGWIQYKETFGFDISTYSDVIRSTNDRWFNDTAVTRHDTPIYDYTDPAMGAITTIPDATTVIYFALRGDRWAYIEAQTDLGLMRGFVDVNELVF